jgi:DNA recombination protein RmuC
MNDPVTIAALAAAVFAVAFLGVLVLWLRERGQSVKLATELAGAVERARLQEDARVTMGDYLRAQAEQTATATAEALLKRTDETFRNREMLHQERLAAQLKPVAESLAKFEAHVTAGDRRSARTAGAADAGVDGDARRGATADRGPQGQYRPPGPVGRTDLPERA